DKIMERLDAVDGAGFLDVRTMLAREKVADHQVAAAEVHSFPTCRAIGVAAGVQQHFFGLNRERTFHEEQFEPAQIVMIDGLISGVDESRRAVDLIEGLRDAGLPEQSGCVLTDEIFGDGSKVRLSQSGRRSSQNRSLWSDIIVAASEVQIARPFL